MQTAAPTFAGTVNTGAPDTASSSAVGASLNPLGNLLVQRASGATSGDVLIACYNGTARNVRMNADGSAVFAGTVVATVVPPSDAKFKENITPAKPQLADVVALGKQLKNFDWNADAPVNDEIRAQRQLGLIAQEAEKVCPSLVKQIGGENPYLGISHDALIMKLLGAITELQAEVEALKGA